MIAALLLLLAGQSAPVAAQALADHELAAQRGGFLLPNGVEVALTVQSQTVLNGAVVLRTVFRADQGAPTLTVYAPKPGTTVVAQRGDAPATGAAAAAPSISYDPRTGIQVTPGAVMPSVSVSSGARTPDAATSADLQAVDASGAGIATDAGQIVVTRTGGLDTVQLRAGDLTVSHFAGNAFGSAIANSGNDRAIDTSTSVSIDLSNAGPDVVGSALLRVQDLGSAVTAMRVQ